jgi:peptide subunit release factor 1 (eRF1)
MTPLIVAVFDRLHARFFDIDDAGVRELDCLASRGMRGGKFHSDRQGSPGWGERGYQQRVREDTKRHLVAVARRLAALERRRPIRDLLLAAPGGIAGTIKSVLPPAVAARVIGTARLNPTELTHAAVHRAARASVGRRERDAEAALLRELQDGLGTGKSVNGVRETLRALAKGQVHTLLVRPGLLPEGFRCAASGRLVPSRADCRGEGDAVPVLDLVGAASEEAVRQRGTVVTARSTALAREIDGLAALLRFQ